MDWLEVGGAPPELGKTGYPWWRSSTVGTLVAAATSAPAIPSRGCARAHRLGLRRSPSWARSRRHAPSHARGGRGGAALQSAAGGERHGRAPPKIYFFMR